MTAEQIAAGPRFASTEAVKLSPELRSMLLRHLSKQAWADSPNSLFPKWSPLGRELKRRGLIQFTGPRDSTTEITPLGLEVRRILQETRDAQ